jgi:hypothetical protein
MKAPDPLWPGPSQSLLKLKRLQRKWKGIWMPLNQQLQEISKWHTPVISCAAKI